MAVYRKEVTESTNTDARAGKPGDVFTAEYQTAGRGRLDHKWLSARGMNLTCSVVLDAGGAEAGEVAALPLVVGLSALQALRGMLPEGAGLELKWPNDVLAGGKKICGILCERHGDMVIAGIGVNVNQREFPEEIRERATSMALEAGREFSPGGEVLERVVEVLFANHGRWREGGFAALHPEFAAVDRLAGRMVAVKQTDDDSEPVRGVCGGIQADGTLLVGGVPVFAGEAHVVGC